MIKIALWRICTAAVIAVPWGLAVAQTTLPTTRTAEPASPPPAPPPVKATELGIIPNSPDDQTALIQKFLEAVAIRGGGEARLEPGQYVIRGSITVPTGVTLRGAWEQPHHGILTRGTVLMAYGGRGTEEGPALIELNTSSGVKGITVCYPEQALADIKPYPWAIHGQGMHSVVEDVTLVNAYNGIVIGPQWNESHLIRNVYGCVLRRGVLIDGTTDIGRLENVHFNPHLWARSGHAGIPADAKPNPDLAVAAYMQEHLEAFIFGRTDWQSAKDCFVFAAKVGYRFVTTPNGSCNGQFIGIGADMSQYAVVADAAQGPGILISSGQFVCGVLQGKAAPRIGVVTGSAFKSTLQLSNCSFWGDFDSFVRAEGPGRISIDQARMDNSGAAGIEIIAGRATIRDVWFEKARGPHIVLRKDVKKAVVEGNFAEGGVQIVNEAGAAAVIKDNE